MATDSTYWSCDDIQEFPVHETHSVPVFEQVQNKILLQRIQKRINEIEDCFFNPQIIILEGYSQFSRISNQCWSNQIKRLFYEANIPEYYILHMWKPNNNSASSDITYIQFISKGVKLYVISALHHFLSFNSNLSVTINSID
jgi:hypothetical protein